MSRVRGNAELLGERGVQFLTAGDRFEKVTFEQNKSKKVRALAVTVSGEKEFQEEKTASIKDLS